ncbi:DUF397 domain-containing protein [Streptomyces sp. NPDC015139]|uniref:DUF397 domain-containing protein n=1 Tax=Streptomyces sp. NPDC015139 TaxID=3364942 RepID=UPI003700D09A
MALNKRALDLAPEGDWLTSSYSNNGGNCVKVAALTSAVGVCDSKQTNGPALAIRPEAWKAFIASVA